MTELKQNGYDPTKLVFLPRGRYAFLIVWFWFSFFAVLLISAVLTFYGFYIHDLISPLIEPAKEVIGLYQNSSVSIDEIMECIK